MLGFFVFNYILLFSLVCLLAFDSIRVIVHFITEQEPFGKGMICKMIK